VKALILKALGRGFELNDVDIATPIGREVLVDVKASGLCHTDLLFATHNFVPTPSVLGHEVAGMVAEVGPDVVQIHVGDHVVGSLAQSCGACARCHSGRSFQCSHPEATLRRSTDAPRLSRKGIGLFQGFGLGGFAERALIHENQLAVVPKEIPFAQEEIFGPVLCVITYDSEGDAIRIANDSEYGLHACVMGTDLQRARGVASQLRADRVVINGMTDDPQAPLGGFKYSGVGREYGRYGIEAFLEPRAILES